jgi:hypothetical protein
VVAAGHLQLQVVLKVLILLQLAILLVFLNNNSLIVLRETQDVMVVFVMLL